MKNTFMLIIAPLLAASLCVHAVERRTVITTLESSWPSRNFSSAMSAPKATCLLIVKSAKSKKDQLEWFHTLVKDPEVAASLKKLNCVKILTESPDIAGWPDGWIKASRGDSGLFLFSGDLKQIVSCASNAEKAQLTPKFFVAVVDGLLAYEAKNPPKQPEPAPPANEPLAAKPNDVEKLLARPAVEPPVRKAVVEEE